MLLDQCHAVPLLVREVGADVVARPDGARGHRLPGGLVTGPGGQGAEPVGDGGEQRVDAGGLGTGASSTDLRGLGWTVDQYADLLVDALRRLLPE